MSEGIDGTPAWAYDEDGYCVCCGNGRWKHHMPECELADALDAARDPVAAVRRFLHLAETGPDYEAAAARIVKEYPNLPKAEREVVVFAKAVVDAALADYLTEEE